MKDRISFIAKILVASWVVSVAIKYSDRAFTLAPSNTNAMVIVLLPCFLMLLVLGWRYIK